MKKTRKATAALIAFGAVCAATGAAQAGLVPVPALWDFNGGFGTLTVPSSPPVTGVWYAPPTSIPAVPPDSIIIAPPGVPIDPLNAPSATPGVLNIGKPGGGAVSTVFVYMDVTLPAGESPAVVTCNFDAFSSVQDTIQSNLRFESPVGSVLVPPGTVIGPTVKVPKVAGQWTTMSVSAVVPASLPSPASLVLTISAGIPSMPIEGVFIDHVTCSYQPNSPIVPMNVDVTRLGPLDFTQPEPATESGFEPINLARLFLPPLAAGVPVQFAAGQEGDVIFVEEGSTIAGCQAFINLDPIAQLSLTAPGCAISDIVRFVNNPATGQGEVWFISDSANVAEFVSVTRFAGARVVLQSVQEQAPPNNAFNTVTVQRSLAGTNIKLTVKYDSDTKLAGTTISDTGEIIAVPALSPVGATAMGALLLALGFAFVARRRRNGGPTRLM